MAKKTIPLDIKEKADEFFCHEKRMICERLLIIKNNKLLSQIENETGISERTLSRMLSQSSNITLYTWCIVKAAIIHLGPQQNPNYNDKP